MKNQKHKAGFIVALALVVSFGFMGTAVADTSSSAHYEVNEVQFGGVGSSLHDCSTNYCAQTSVGNTAVGNASSDNYKAFFGSVTPDEPRLAVVVTGGNQDLGVLDPSKTGTASYGVSVISYLSGGYTLQITGSSPSQGSHALNRLASPSTSQPGTEQFGINMVKNATPDVGADPVQVPSSTFSFGSVKPNYSNADEFMYQADDIVASSDKSSGETDYTLSMILNVSNVTPGGRYVGSFSAVAVATF